MNQQKNEMSLVDELKARSKAGEKIAFVSGNFNVVHPGHLRLLKFAADCADILVVGVNSSGRQDLYLLPVAERLDAVAAIGIVDYAIAIETPAAEFIAKIKPAVVVKGKEYEGQSNPEQQIVDCYGGKLLFSSGEVRFSSLDLLKNELFEINFSAIKKPSDFRDRHNFSLNDLVKIVDKFSDLKVVVIGDLIVDEYVNCSALGMSREDPTLVVAPINTDVFIGGAGIVSAHASMLGAQVKYFGVTGNDVFAKNAKDNLEKYKVSCHFLSDDSRPTTVKQRFRVDGKTLLRVSHLKQHEISPELTKKMYGSIIASLKDCNLLIFSDFNYGCLPQGLVNQVELLCRQRGIMCVADSQTSSQVGDITRFKNMHLLTPTEHEARVGLRDYNSGLVVLANELQKQANAKQLFITLGQEGLLIHAPSSKADRYLTDQLPAFVKSPKDVAGAGDSLLTCAAMALAVGANIWQSAYLGSIAAACQVSRVGNLPLTAKELRIEVQS
jgi:rfaE bifunctional protein kinase chain/domain